MQVRVVRERRGKEGQEEGARMGAGRGAIVRGLRTIFLNVFSFSYWGVIFFC